MKKITFITVLLLSSLVMASPFVKPSEPNGKLNFSVSHASKDIFPVSLFEIDGKQIIRRDTGVWLKPGVHSIRVGTKVDYNSRSFGVSKLQKSNNPPQDTRLEITVEEGKTYFVGYDTSDRDPNKWRPVVWKVE